ncbi:MAG TPA: rod shape-determining protein [Acidimicrobiales bacterium]|jgi:rod shape-determining protein MreB|nr:rod shape-determining protein [Acidimicrobiales bacterium]
MSALAVDLGTARTLAVDVAGSVVVDEPTLAAIDISNGDLIAFGRAAVGLTGRAAGEIAVVRPVRHGQLADLELTHHVAKELLLRARRHNIYRPDVTCCVPASATGVQRRALERSFRRAGARGVSFIDHSIAAAIGSHVRLDEHLASMVVDVGAGTSDMAVMAIGGVVTEASVLVGGRDFDDAIRGLLKSSFDLHISSELAEQIKMAIGTAWPDEEKKVEVAGRDMGNGRARTVTLSTSEVAGVLFPHVEAIVAATVDCITSSPPDLANDLLTRGLYLAGGGALLGGFARRLATAAGIPTHLVNDPELVTVLGAARTMRRG